MIQPTLAAAVASSTVTTGLSPHTAVQLLVSLTCLVTAVAEVRTVAPRLENPYAQSEELSWFGERWGNLTIDLLKRAETEPKLKILSRDPLLIEWGDFLSDEWLDEAIAYAAVAAERRQGAASAGGGLRWCVVTGERHTQEFI
eukprot:SAG31_NODE_19417_length_603_cov_0.563492_1_plen_142_part_01